MEEIKVYGLLSENLKNLRKVEDEIAIIELARYERTKDNIKKEKLNEIKEYFEAQAKLYNQKSEAFKENIEKIINISTQQIEKLYNIYDNLYLNVFKIMQTAMNSQKKDVAEIVNLKEKLQDENCEEEEKQKINNTIIATAERKLNCDVIIDECNARLKWCSEEIQKDMQEIFKIDMYQLQVYKDNVISKIRRWVFNFMSGKKNYKRTIENYQIKNLKDIQLKDKDKIFNAKIVINGVIKQMKLTNREISRKYQEKVQYS